MKAILSMKKWLTFILPLAILLSTGCASTQPQQNDSSLPPVVHWDKLVEGVSVGDIGLTPNITPFAEVAPKDAYVSISSRTNNSGNMADNLQGRMTIVSSGVPYLKLQHIEIAFLVFVAIKKADIKADTLIDINYIEYPLAELSQYIVHEDEEYVIYEFLPLTTGMSAEDAIVKQCGNTVEDGDKPYVAVEDVQWMIEARNAFFKQEDMFISFGEEKYTVDRQIDDNGVHLGEFIRIDEIF